MARGPEAPSQPSDENPFKRVVFNTGLLYSRMALTVGLSLYTTRLTLAALGVVDFGIFQVVGGAITMLAFLRGTLAVATQRFLSYSQGAGNQPRVRQIFRISQRLHRWVAFGVFLCLEAGGVILFRYVFRMPVERLPAAHWVYQAACFSTVASVLSVPYDAAINAHEHMGVLAFTATLEAILKLTVAFYLFHTGFDRLLVFGVLMMAVTLVSILLRVAYCRRTYGECQPVPGLPMDQELLREMTTFGGWSFLSSATSLVNGYGIGVVLNTFFGTTVNAAQGVANQISGQLAAFAITLLKAVNPLIDKSEGAGARERMLRVTLAASKAAFFLLAILAVPVMLELPWLFQHWLGVVPAFAVVFTELWLARALVEQLFVPLISAIRAVGDIRRYEVAFSVATLVPLPLSYLLFHLGYAPPWIYLVNLGYALTLLILTSRFLALSTGYSLPRLLTHTALRCVLALGMALILPAWIRLSLAPGLVRVSLVSLSWLVGFLAAFWVLGLAREERHRARHEATAALQTLRQHCRKA